MSDVPGGYVILGGSGGIGAETCRRLVASGGRVLLAGRNESTLREVAGELEAPFRVLDVRSFEAVEAVLQEAAEQFDGLLGVANCVGSVLLKPAHLTTFDEWQATLEANLTTAFATVRAAAKVMRGRGGSIVLVSSAAARIGVPNHEAIAAAKAGVAGLMRSAAASYAGRGIRVNAVAPGLIRTPLTRRIWGHEKSAEASLALHALGRLGEPRDAASLIAWLLSPDNDWVTGQEFGVDGGLATVRSGRG